MFDLKRCAIKMASNIKVLESKRGKVFLKNDLIMKGLLKNKEYEELVIKSVFLMEGIKGIDFDYDNMKTIISYDYITLTEKNVVKWIKLIIEVLLDNYEDIKKCVDENNKDRLISFIESKLKKEVMCMYVK
ncbi:hypothetical protein [Clostridium sp.]|uniref:hypothetical protein n=1 Tax=Clostridium sp. TaxID=1506 RepID=UPI0026023A72|nr:hypothetical protein [Clostridium sp.]